MRICLSLIIFLLTPVALGACQFKSDIKSIYSLSGPITTGLKKIGLLNDPLVKGISVFYPTVKAFKGERIPGGIFLSPELRKNFKGSTIFFDEGLEMRKWFSPIQKEISGVEVKTRSLVPMEVTELVIMHLASVVVGCEKEFFKYRSKTQELQQSLEKQLVKPLPVIFFLGEFRGERPPELIMANDGIVKWLREKKLIKTYPSELAYVNWSAKILNQMPKKTYRVGIKDSGQDQAKRVVKENSHIMTVIYPGALIPGFNQLQAWNFWLKNL